MGVRAETATSARQGANPARTDPGSAIRAGRMARRLGTRQLARRLGRAHSVVSRWEAGILEPTFLDLDRIGRLLQVPLGSLVLAGGPGRRWSSRSHPRRRRALVGEALGRARRAAGIDLRNAVRVTGIAGRRIDRIEGGADPSLAELRALLALVGLTAADLIDRVRTLRRAGSGTGLDTLEISPEVGAHRMSARPVVRLVASRKGVPEPGPDKETRVVLNKIMLVGVVLGPLAA